MLAKAATAGNHHAPLLADVASAGLYVSLEERLLDGGLAHLVLPGSFAAALVLQLAGY
jgi:hypothetical protein